MDRKYCEFDYCTAPFPHAALTLVRRTDRAICLIGRSADFG
jgi:hypothetical protein